MRATCLGLLILAALFLGAAWGSQRAGSSATTPVAAAIFGDLDCGGALAIGDAQKLARNLIGLPVTQGEGCPAIGAQVDPGGADLLWGDLDCGGSLAIGDAQKLARMLIGLSVSQAEGCPRIGGLTPGLPNSELAEYLASRLASADSDDGRYEVLRLVMDALRIGVYTADGAEVQQGAERGPGDFYLYDFELRMMAASLGRGDSSWGVQQVADTLDQVGYREDGQPFTGDDLNQILHEATAESVAQPEEESSFVPLLVRELGLGHEVPYDLAEELDVNAASFDALQLTLILVGLTLPVIEEEGPLDAPASTLAAGSNGVLTSRPVSLANCDDFRGTGIWGAKAVKLFVTAQRKIGAVGKRVAAFIDIYHGEQLALSVRVRALDSAVGPTHYDHGAGAPGQNLQFRIEVRMLDDLGQTLVECGWLATLDFPAQGPIPGVRVSFQTDIQNELKDHGTLDCSGFACDRTTDTSGIGTLTFDPKSETQPYGLGIETEVTGVVSGIAWYQSKFKNIFGLIAQFLVPKYGSTRWWVRYHGCPSGAPSVVGAAAGPSEGPPCAFTGEARATQRQQFFDETYTITASNLRFKLEPPDPAHPDRATYVLVEGNVTVQVTGSAGDCTISGGYSIPAPMAEGGAHVFGGSIELDTESNLYAANGGVADYEEHVFYYCPGQPPVWVGTIGAPWVLTRDVPPVIPDRPFTPGDPLQGTFDTDALSGWHSHYEWNFEPLVCSPGPQPVCP